MWSARTFCKEPSKQSRNQPAVLPSYRLASSVLPHIVSSLLHDGRKRRGRARVCRRRPVVTQRGRRCRPVVTQRGRRCPVCPDPSRRRSCTTSSPSPAVSFVRMSGWSGSRRQRQPPPMPVAALSPLSTPPCCEPALAPWRSPATPLPSTRRASMCTAFSPTGSLYFVSSSILPGWLIFLFDLLPEGLFHPPSHFRLVRLMQEFHRIGC